jgi:hypothetical protein
MGTHTRCIRCVLYQDTGLAGIIYNFTPPLVDLEGVLTSRPFVYKPASMFEWASNNTLNSAGSANMISELSILPTDPT